MVAATLALTLAAVAVLALAPAVGWQFLFIAKPLIDTGWSAEYMFFGFRPPEIIGAGVAGVILLRIVLFSGDRSRKRMPLTAPWIAYSISVVLGSFMYAMANNYIGGLSFFLRAMNGVIAFYSLAALFATRDRFRGLLFALLVAGIFPMATGFYEAVTGNYWRLRLGSGDQIRITGLYHNSTNLRYFAYLTLTAIVLYAQYFARRRLLVKLLLAAYAAVCAVVLFKVYSKAGFLAVGVAGLIWAIFGRRTILVALMSVVIVTVNIVMDDVVVKELSTTFQKETAALQGTGDKEIAFGGRLYFWRRQLDDFASQDAIHQLLGGSDERAEIRSATGGGHNDFIRALKQTGLLGTVVYVWLLVAAGILLLRRALRRRTPLNVMSLSVYCAWLIETIGFTPSLYTTFQWYVWGFIGLSLVGVRGLDAVAQKKQAGESGDEEDPGDEKARPRDPWMPRPARMPAGAIARSPMRP